MSRYGISPSGRDRTGTEVFTQDFIVIPQEWIEEINELLARYAKE